MHISLVVKRRGQKPTAARPAYALVQTTSRSAPSSLYDITISYNNYHNMISDNRRVSLRQTKTTQLTIMINTISYKMSIYNMI